ncbi:sensor histidine kinase [Haloarcula amylovorans]|uniref:sensor histidine kinase n=1 Tax=Haloarcula amylovorans TaxID=2562280 RepID=UPI001076630D|nr:HAMP domain-containing sensor histidine kinase [Halomicroarcula amylolytica]
MGYLIRCIAIIGGRRVLFALGGLYILFAAGVPVVSLLGDRPTEAALTTSILVGTSGIVLFYGGHRLPETNIRPDVFPVVAGWCIRAGVLMIGILLFMTLITTLTDPIANFLILSGLASVAGLGMGYHDGQAKTRAKDAEEYGEKLERQNERLESFASLLAHELRNPVSIGQIYTHQLSETDNPQAVGYVAEAFDRIENTIDIMLVLARGQKALSEQQPVTLAGVAQDAWDEIETPEATLTVQTDLTIAADETYLRHLLRNLFENAVEHGGDDVTVTVDDLPTGFYVVDDGKGIPVDVRETIFERGYTTAADDGGMGVGLTFVKTMADIYGWECSLTASTRGGARFEFENMY